MKTLLLVLLFGFLSGPTQTVKIKTSAICEMCKERIEKNLALTKGVEKSDLNVEDQAIPWCIIQIKSMSRRLSK